MVHWRRKELLEGREKNKKDPWEMGENSNLKEREGGIGSDIVSIYQFLNNFLSFSL
jgi:hypothetical protein